MRYLIILIVLLTSTICSAATTGVRPNAATDIGALSATDSIPVDRANTSSALKTTPAGITSYVQGQLSGILAPAFHNHSTATSSRSGYQSSTDKGRFDAMYSASVPASATEGAIGSGTWTSLATAGYTVETAQAKWPYLTSTGAIGGTHLIQGTADLAAYGVDWAALQSCVYKSAAGQKTCFVSNGTYVVERPVVLGTGLALISKSAIVSPKEGTANDGLISIPAAALDVLLEGLSFSETLKYTYGGTYNAIKLNAGASKVTVKNCNFKNLNSAVYVVSTFSCDNEGDCYNTKVTIDSNYTFDTKYLLYATSLTAGQSISGRITNNNFKFNYRAGYSSMITAVNSTSLSQLLVESNMVIYGSLIDVQCSTSCGISYNTITTNTVLGNAQDNRPAITLIGRGDWENIISNNYLWHPANIGSGTASPIVVGSQTGLLINGNTFGHSTSPMISITSPITNLSIANNMVLSPTSPPGNTNKSVFQYSAVTTSSPTTVFLSGNYTSYQNERVQVAQTDVSSTLFLRIIGDINDDWSGSGAVPLTAYTIFATGNITLPSPGGRNYPGYFAGKRWKIVNETASAITVSAVELDYNTTGFMSATGTRSATYTVPANSAVTFRHYYGSPCAWKVQTLL